MKLIRHIIIENEMLIKPRYKILIMDFTFRKLRRMHLNKKLNKYYLINIKYKKIHLIIWTLIILYGECQYLSLGIG